MNHRKSRNDTSGQTSMKVVPIGISDKSSKKVEDSAEKPKKKFKEISAHTTPLWERGEKEQQKAPRTFHMGAQLHPAGFNVGKLSNVLYMSEKQAKCAEMIDQNIYTFIHGPVGTAKTFIPVAYALAALEAEKIEYIIFARNNVETEEAAGKTTGFLPGGLREKADPFVAPMIEIADELIGKKRRQEYEAAGKIRIMSLKHMRGANIKNCAAIVDEAQNNSNELNKTISGRGVNNFKIIFAGDVTQMDTAEEFRDNYYHMAQACAEEDDVAFFEYHLEDYCRDPLIHKLHARIDIIEDARKENIKNKTPVKKFKHS